MKYWKTDIDNIMSGDFAMIVVTLAIYVCYLYATLTYSRCCRLRKYLHFSDFITVNVESISFCFKLKSIVLMLSVFPSSFIFLHNSPLFSVHFWFFSFIAFL